MFLNLYVKSWQVYFNKIIFLLVVFQRLINKVSLLKYILFQLLGTDAGARWRQLWVEIAPFYVNKDIDKLIHDTEVCFYMHSHISVFW